MNRVERTITALMMAGPVCLKVRYKHYPRCCVEGAQAGAEALRRRGLKAEAVEVIAAVREGEDRQWWLGATQREAYDLMRTKLADPSAAVPTFEEYGAQAQSWDDDGRHMVIEIRERDRWLLDLTLAQAELEGIPPVALMQCEGEGWPQCGKTRGFDLVYALPTRPPVVAAANYRNEGLTLDMLDAMRLAISAGLDRDRFASALSARFRG